MREYGFTKGEDFNPRKFARVRAKGANDYLVRDIFVHNINGEKGVAFRYTLAWLLLRFQLRIGNILFTVRRVKWEPFQLVRGQRQGALPLSWCAVPYAAALFPQAPQSNARAFQPGVQRLSRTSETS